MATMKLYFQSVHWPFKLFINHPLMVQKKTVLSFDTFYKFQTPLMHPLPCLCYKGVMVWSCLESLNITGHYQWCPGHNLILNFWRILLIPIEDYSAHLSDIKTAAVTTLFYIPSNRIRPVWWPLVSKFLRYLKCWIEHYIVLDMSA